MRPSTALIAVIRAEAEVVRGDIMQNLEYSFTV